MSSWIQMAERNGIFSDIKRMFGESVIARKFPTWFRNFPRTDHLYSVLLLKHSSVLIHTHTFSTKLYHIIL